jgi:hypothetical protein
MRDHAYSATTRANASLLWAALAGAAVAAKVMASATLLLSIRAAKAITVRAAAAAHAPSATRMLSLDENATVGATALAAAHVQLKQGIISLDELASDVATALAASRANLAMGTPRNGGERGGSRRAARYVKIRQDKHEHC